MKACVVRHVDTEEYYKFTLGEKGEIIIIGTEDYDLDKLIVSLVPLEEVQILENDYYVVVQEVHCTSVGDYGE